MKTKPKKGDILKLNFINSYEVFIVINIAHKGGNWSQLRMSTGILEEPVSWGSDMRFYIKLGEASSLQRAMYLNEY